MIVNSLNVSNKLFGLLSFSPYANHRTSVRPQALCNDDKLLVVMSIDNHKQKEEEEDEDEEKKRKSEEQKEEDSFIDDTVQMNFFICLMYMRDSSTDAVNEKETETEH